MALIAVERSPVIILLESLHIDGARVENLSPRRGEAVLGVSVSGGGLAHGVAFQAGVLFLSTISKTTHLVNGQTSPHR